MGSGENSNRGEGCRKAISTRPKHFHLPLPGEQEPGGEGSVTGGIFPHLCDVIHPVSYTPPGCEDQGCWLDREAKASPSS